jgi:hypothetical protein
MAEIDDPKRGRPDAEFPSFNFPSVFADGVLSHVNSLGMSKFYLYRTDPNMFGRGGAITTPTVQINMPTHGLVQSVAFLHQRVQFLIRRGDVTQSDWDQALKDNELPPVDTKAPQ